MEKGFWIKLTDAKDGRKAHYFQTVLNNDIFRMPHKTRKEAENWIKNIADGRNWFTTDFYVDSSELESSDYKEFYNNTI
tara:strand:+ start:335 stop:571 length:237 start_codon:yes stop_codon:yes gene_type:complete